MNQLITKSQPYSFMLQLLLYTQHITLEKCWDLFAL